MQPAFSIIIPTWNNLPYLKLCVASIRKNSSFGHQIIVHVNEGTDGTLEWVKSEGLDFTYSEQNIGICLACNMMRTRVKADYILYLNDDMYLLPGWDKALMDEIKAMPDNRFFLSGTMIQPHNRLDVGILANYGDSVETFEEERLLKEHMQYPLSDWRGATWPPNLLHRDIWDLVGGYSIEYSPGMYSDPDLTAKLWMVGIRRFKGVANCRAYHFETKSTLRVTKNQGHLQFLFKWGLTNRMMRRHLTHLGTPYDQPTTPSRLKSRWVCRLKAAWAIVTGKQFGPVKPLQH